MNGSIAIKEAQLHWVAKRQEAEASSLGLRPGQWPQYVNVELDPRRSSGLPSQLQPQGERLYTLKSTKRSADMDVLWVDYESAGGRRLRIIND